MRGILVKKDSKESVKRQIAHYTTKHQELAALLEMEERKRVPNEGEIRRMKKLKLMYKDKLTELRARLEQKSSSAKPSAEVIALPIHHPVPHVVRSRRTAAG